jgi:hypothetical protein
MKMWWNAKWISKRALDRYRVGYVERRTKCLFIISEWLDDCEAAQGGGAAAAATNDHYNDDDDDDALPASSGLGRKKPAASANASSLKNSNNARSIDLGEEDSEDDED